MELGVCTFAFFVNKFLVIQTSFIGDVILATALLEKLQAHYPNGQIDICVRKGNESLFVGHPFIGTVHIWDKKDGKYKNVLSLTEDIRKQGYDVLVNLQRYGSTGFITVFSGAKEKIGFNKNPLSMFFSKRFKHEISAESTLHEVERNQKMIAHFTDNKAAKPKLYPSENDFAKAKALTAGTDKEQYITLSPASVWYTKQLPKEKWIELIDKIPAEIQIFILGGPGDAALGDEIIKESGRGAIQNVAGQLSLLGSAALMRNAQMNYVNDSAPLHLCSAMNAPVTAFFCSTVPAFGFTPLSDCSIILETNEKLSCRPCGLHGFKKCPEGHFKCAEINVTTSHS